MVFPLEVRENADRVEGAAQRAQLEATARGGLVVERRLAVYGESVVAGEREEVRRPLRQRETGVRRVCNIPVGDRQLQVRIDERGARIGGGIDEAGSPQWLGVAIDAGGVPAHHRRTSGPVAGGDGDQQPVRQFDRSVIR